MELANSGNLRDIIFKNRLLDEKQVHYYISQIVNGYV
jgi:hypothetical protein